MSFRQNGFVFLPLIPNSPASFAGQLLTQEEGTTSAKLYYFKNRVYLSANGQWEKWQVYDRHQNNNGEEIRAKNDQGELGLLISQDSPDTYIVTAQGDGWSFQSKPNIK